VQGPTGFDADRPEQRGLHDALLHVLVGEVGAGEARQLEVELVAGVPVADARRQVGEGGDALVEHVVVGTDRRGQVGAVLDQDGVDPAVLVLGVGGEEPGDGPHVRSQGGARRGVGGVERPGRLGDGEELGADALVDVAVQRDGGGGGCHAWMVTGARSTCS
jgi:hypothetical protein